MVHGSQTTLKERNTCFLFFRTFPKEPSQQILIHIFHFETQRKTLALWHHHHRSHLRKLTPMEPEKKAQRHGKRTKNIYQTIIPSILLNSGYPFLGVLRNLHLFTFSPNERTPKIAGPCSSMDSRPQCLAVAMWRIAKTWCDHPGGHRDEWPGPQLYEQVTEIHGNSNPKESRRWTKVAFWQILPFQVRIPISLWSHLLRLVGLDRIWVSSPKNLLPKKRMQRMPWKMEKMMALEDDSLLFEMVPISGYRLW